MIHMSTRTLHKVLGSMSQERTDNPPGIWGYVGCLVHWCLACGVQTKWPLGEETSLLRNGGFTVTGRWDFR